MFSSGFICLAVPLFIETDKLPPFHPPKEKGKKQNNIYFFICKVFFPADIKCYDCVKHKGQGCEMKAKLNSDSNVPQET